MNNSLPPALIAAWKGNENQAINFHWPYIIPFLSVFISFPFPSCLSPLRFSFVLVVFAFVNFFVMFLCFCPCPLDGWTPRPGGRIHYTLPPKWMDHALLKAPSTTAKKPLAPLLLAMWRSRQMYEPLSLYIVLGK